MSTNKPARILLLILLPLTALLASGIGAMTISPAQTVAILLGKAGIHLPVNYTEGMANVLWQIRLPRVILAILVGAGLAVSGAAFQGLYRNPMADPALTGVSGGASLFAVLVILSIAGWPGISHHAMLQNYLISIATFIGAGLTTLVVLRLARTGGRTPVATLLLAGLAVNALCNACTGLMTYTATNEQLRSIVFWMLGSLGAASWSVLAVVTPLVLIPVLLLPTLGKSLNVYSLGESEAHYLGVNVARLKIQLLLLSALAVGACVAVTVIIGFVGLIVPHLLRSTNGTDHRRLLIDSALLGAIILTLSDVISRTIIAPAELPIGIITAILGTPLFIGLLLKQKKQLSSLSF